MTNLIFMIPLNLKVFRKGISNMSDIQSMLNNNPFFSRGACTLSKWSDMHVNKKYRIQCHSDGITYRAMDIKFKTLCEGDIFSMCDYRQTTISDKPTVILIHGYANTQAVMQPLYDNLINDENIGNVFNIRYASMFLNLDQVTLNISDIISSIEGPIYIIGHSLGGLVAMKTYEQMRNKKNIERMILVASPVNGSLSAKKMLRFPGFEKIAGPIIHDLIKGVKIPEIPSLGIISGYCNGIGKSAILKDINDGIVSIKETIPAVAHQSILLNYAHTPIIKAARTIHECNHFLNNGYFSDLK